MCCRSVKERVECLGSVVDLRVGLRVESRVEVEFEFEFEFEFELGLASDSGLPSGPPAQWTTACARMACRAASVVVMVGRCAREPKLTGQVVPM